MGYKFLVLFFFLLEGILYLATHNPLRNKAGDRRIKWQR